MSEPALLRPEPADPVAASTGVVSASEHEALEERIARLWDELRAARARIRFGDPKQIIARARQEERIERAA